MARGKSISVYLIDGIASGKIKAQISNWNGVAYKIPRALLSECQDFEAFQQSGVYFLFGDRSVYVGQAEVRKTGKGIHQRIRDHEVDKLKDSWDEVVIFTTKDNSFGRTDISYLENRFYNKALAAGQYNLLNSVEPTIGTVTEEKESELEEFMDQAELILGALGYRVFDQRDRFSNPVNADSVILNCVYVKLFTAEDHLSTRKFDIEHLATKERMRTVMKRYDELRLPVSCIANFCYLPEDINRGKKEKTIYRRFGDLRKRRLHHGVACRPVYPRRHQRLAG